MSQTLQFNTDAEKTAYVRREVGKASDEIRAKYPLLDNQNLIGSLVMAGSIAVMLACTWLYAIGAIAWFVAVPVIAIATSLIHELEHDLIHLMYFKKTPWAYNLMMALCWITRPGTINPWTRRRMHLHHHKFSGETSDLEEYGITNGERWGLKRLLMIGDNMLSVLFRAEGTRRKVLAYVEAQKPETAADRRKLRLEQLLSYMPVGRVYYTLWHTFIVYHVVMFVAPLVGHPLTAPLWLTQAMHVIDFLAVVWMAPNFVRSFCINFVSSNMHYFGDIDARNVVQQTQVLNPWWMIPFQVFCFNFGSTHAIHHFVVRDPFYIRQLTAKRAHVVLREVGVRFNDIGTFKRANRWGSDPTKIIVRPQA